MNSPIALGIRAIRSIKHKPLKNLVRNPKLRSQLEKALSNKTPSMIKGTHPLLFKKK